MTRITRLVFQFSLSAILVLAIAFSSAAQQNERKGKATGSDAGISSAESARGKAAQSDVREEARERSEKGLERKEEAMPRDATVKEETSPQGLEKQRETKTEQEHMEKDKGSEQGQRMREEHSRKWWKFWE